MLSKAPLIMGVLNVTPDSFSDGGLYLHKETAFRHALSLCEAGADVIDIGGESSRPGALPVSVQEELDRLMPVLEKLTKESSVRISIDTVKPAVMQEAIRLGVWMINDIHALRSPGALAAAAASSCHVCLMHMQGSPQTMQTQPTYQDVLKEVSDFFAERIQACVGAGISTDRLWLDPGTGFGKQFSHQLTLLKEMRAFLKFNLPVMVGISRKSILGHLVNQPVDQRMPAGLAAAVFLYMQGVKMIRTHDVKATKEAITVLQAIAEA